jgi:hypothetical protein
MPRIEVKIVLILINKRKQKIRISNVFTGILGVNLCPNFVPINIIGNPKRNNNNN